MPPVDASIGVWSSSSGSSDGVVVGEFVVSGAEPESCSAYTTDAGSSSREIFSRLIASLRGVFNGLTALAVTGGTVAGMASALD